MNFLSHYKPLFGKYRYKVCFSGRGSGKSFHIALALLWYASRCKMKILCLREHLNSISDSSKAQLEEIIDKTGTRDAWTITKTEITHNTTGSIFLFKGMATNYNSIKSIPNVDIAWIEECETISKESLDILIPTIRKKESQIWLSGNPKDRMEAVSQMFIENEMPPDSIVISNNYRDNPYISKTLLAEAQHMLATNPELYSHIWIGNYLDTSNLIMIHNASRGEIATSMSDKIVVGIDIARSGGDRTCICVRKGKRILELLIYNTMEIDKLTHEIDNLKRKYPKIEQINVDSTGHGAWLPDALKVKGIIVKSVCFSENADRDTIYANKRTELYGLAQQFFDKGGKIRPHDIELAKELESSYYVLDNKNRTKLITKDEIKKKIGRSPDLADAFCLSLVTTGDMFKSTAIDDELAEHLMMIDVLNAGKSC